MPLRVYLIPGQRLLVGGAVLTLERVDKAPRRHRRDEFPWQARLAVEAPPGVVVRRLAPGEESPPGAWPPPPVTVSAWGVSPE